MIWYKVCLTYLAMVYTIVKTSEGLPNVIIGDPHLDLEDKLGPAITDAEFKNALADETLISQPDGDSPLSTQDTFFQGDIQLKSEEELRELMMNSDSSQLRSAKKYLYSRWPNAQVPYIISSSYSDRERKRIARAIAEFHSQTCLRFIPRTTQSDYIHIRKGGTGCSSSIGRVGGEQTVSLDQGCVWYAIIIHELMHAVGFWHEQSRYDRDDYVTIKWDNIIDNMEYNFDKSPVSASQDLGLTYDYSSVMHYDTRAFAIDRRYPTIIAKKSGAKIDGAYKGPSKLDIEGLNVLYQCECAKDDFCDGCKFYKSLGYCHHAEFDVFMKKHCRRSCNYCCADHKDHADKCPEYAQWGQCDAGYRPNLRFMRANCRKSCKLCFEYDEASC